MNLRKLLQKMIRYIKALLTKHKKKSLPSFLKNTWFDEWMSYGYITLITGFIFQGIFYAGWRENVIKISIDTIITIGLWLMGCSLWVAIIIAHTVNFCFNGQALCVFYHIKAGNTTAENFYKCTLAMKKRIDNAGYISAAISYGSLSKGNWHTSSDIDIRFIPKSGWQNQWKACLFAVRERIIAFCTSYPLDLYVMSMYRTAKTMKKGEIPLVFKDLTNEYKQYFDSEVRFEDFQEMFVKMHLKK